MKITENAPPKYKLQYLNPPHLYHSILIAQSKHTHYSYICIISYLSICTTFRQVQISEVPNAMLFCYPLRDKHSGLTISSCNYTLPCHCRCTPLAQSCSCGMHLQGAPWWEAHMWGACPWLLLWATPTSTALRPSTTASSIWDGCHVQALWGLSFLMLRLSDIYS